MNYSYLASAGIKFKKHMHVPHIVYGSHAGPRSAVVGHLTCKS